VRNARWTQHTKELLHGGGEWNMSLRTKVVLGEEGEKVTLHHLRRGDQESTALIAAPKSSTKGQISANTSHQPPPARLYSAYPLARHRTSTASTSNPRHVSHQPLQWNDVRYTARTHACTRTTARAHAHMTHAFMHEVAGT
jgi:hypothetical protein